ncbi:hypothetical protein J1N35_021320 [Gossypium stocksii]|uniref:Ninja-family protein n=1 Tax=Gossypium stocksii TaxID=47602 RepID=A0A9D3VGI5_9ROSI|nr:hypothetical protein J1N35_021320 [Gossypium stocksii]
MMEIMDMILSRIAAKMKGIGKLDQTKSPMYSSSVVSDLQSSSNQGGRSSESGTNTSPCQPAEHTQINCSAGSNQKGRSEQSCTSHQNDSAQSMDKCSKGGIEKTPSVESTSLNLKKAPPKPEIKSSNSTKDTNKGEMGKAPKPPAPPIHDGIVSLRNMPCVSTTGNGPDGKTINGFLYRCTKSEVSIICVCHGSSFSPAEFVQHAGGSDVSHPLRHYRDSSRYTTNVAMSNSLSALSSFFFFFFVF